MTDSKITDSDLDLNERNSWTVLCECNVLEKSSSEKCAPTIDEPADLVLVQSNESFEKLNPADVTSDDSSNLNEDVADAEIVHECKQPKITCRSKSKKKRHARNKSRDIGTFFIIGTVLAITGASLLCLLVPKGVNLETSNVSQLKANCTKLGIMKENSQASPPIKAVVSRYGSKTVIKDKDGSLQAYLSNQGFSPNTTTVLEAAKCFGPPKPPAYQTFEKKIDAFNKQCQKTSLAETTPKLMVKPYGPMIKVKPQASKVGQKLIPLIESSPSKAPTTSDNHTPLHCKLICDILQDLALLKLTQVIARRMSEKAAKRKKRMEAKKKTVSKQSESLLRLQKRISKTTVSLWDELPFNKQIALKPTMSAIVEEDDARRVSSKMSLTEIGAARCISMEKHRRRQLEYLAKLKREHSDRMAYLKGIRERQQESIQALIQERKQDFSKLDAYAEHQNHIMEGKRRLLEINNYYTKLKNGLASKSALALNSPANSQLCKKIISLSNFPTTSSDNDGAACLPPETILSEGTKEKNVASPYYLSARKKYYEQIASYWSKREEYLNERINFMREAADSMKEIMTRFRNKNGEDCSDSKCALVNIISEASLVFPENANLQRLKSEAQMIDPCTTLTKNESYLQLNRYRSLHNFGKDRPRRFSLSTNEELKDDVLYNELFGKNGTQIRKRDLAIWNCSKFQKPLQKDLVQQEVRKRHISRKGNKELKQPDLNTK